MSIRKKLFLSYLIPLCIVTGVFMLIERAVPENSPLVYVIGLILLGIGILVYYFLSRSFSRNLQTLIGELRKIEVYEGISSQGNDEIQGLSRGIKGILRKTRESEQKLNMITEITRSVSSLLHLQEVLDAIVNLLTREFKLDACSIRLLDSDGNLRIKSQKGLSKRFIETATRKPTIDSYSGECFLTGKLVIINDIEKIDKPISTTLLVGEDIHSFAVTPIEAEEKIIGVLVAASKKKNYFHERFSDVIYIIATQIGIAIRISQLYDKVYTFSQELEKAVQKRTEELDEKSKRLIEAERFATAGKMANRVADECRNSLTIVGGFSRRLYEKTPDNDPKKKDLRLIVEQVKVLEDKVSKIIDFEKEA
jgi:signal transduction protein with GAF and PtsI domain